MPNQTTTQALFQASANSLSHLPPNARPRNISAERPLQKKKRSNNNQILGKRKRSTKAPLSLSANSAVNRIQSYARASPSTTQTDKKTRWRDYGEKMFCRPNGNTSPIFEPSPRTVGVDALGTGIHVDWCLMPGHRTSSDGVISPILGSVTVRATVAASVPLSVAFDEAPSGRGEAKPRQIRLRGVVADVCYGTLRDEAVSCYGRVCGSPNLCVRHPQPAPKRNAAGTMNSSILRCYVGVRKVD